MTTIDLFDLVGLHTLSGWDMSTYSTGSYWGDSDVLNLVLDGKTHSFFEDANDGYRSALEKVEVTDTPVMTTFPPVQVLAVRNPDSDDKTLQFFSTTTGRLVAEVGTHNWADYYPTFVHYINPTAF